jgi:hypothetical protein
MREAEKQFYARHLRQEYCRVQQLQRLNQELTAKDLKHEEQRPQNCFPFVSGELLERQRKCLHD